MPRLLAMLCILAVFLPSFFMEGAARELFVPLSLAVGFAMVTSYLLSSTFVPVLSVWLLRHSTGHAPRAHGTAAGRLLLRALQQAYARLLSALVLPARWAAAAGYLRRGRRAWSCSSAASVGTEIFPQVDSGQFQLRVRRPAGTRIEQTEEIARQDAGRHRARSVGPDNVGDLGRLRRRVAVELHDQHRLPVDGGPGGSGPARRAASRTAASASSS